MDLMVTNHFSVNTSSMNLVRTLALKPEDNPEACGLCRSVESYAGINQGAGSVLLGFGALARRYKKMAARFSGRHGCVDLPASSPVMTGKRKV